MAVAQQEYDQRSVLFHAPAGLEIPAQLVEVGDTCVVVELSPETWETVDVLSLFHLQPANRQPGLISAGVAVRIELWRAPDAGPSNPAELAELLLSCSITDPANALLSTATWYALTVTEERYAQGPARLATGFATRWRNEAPHLAIAG